MKLIIDEKQIESVLSEAAPSTAEVSAIISKAREKKGLELDEAVALLDGADDSTLFSAAAAVKKEIYGKRLVLFAPLYLSSYCVNDCAYCGFHASNPSPRKKLSHDEIVAQVRVLESMGHKRLLLEAGEHPDNSIDYVTEAMKTIYSTKGPKGQSIRRLNVNIAATTKENYARLKEAGIGTYQLFQETYHRATYGKLHCGPKADYERQLTALDRAFEAGIEDVGIGALFGLYDWRFEVLALIQHAQYLEQKHGVGPHTISVPRFRPAPSVGLQPTAFSDSDFLRAIAVLRLSVPYTGMILSTRESPSLRSKAFELGISQASAASVTEPGGYGKAATSTAQFETADHRSLDEVVLALCSRGLLPSFCTACYRSNRTGCDFMELAKKGAIQDLCTPNAALTFKEYLLDHASIETRTQGEALLEKAVRKVQGKTGEELCRRLKRLEEGERDLFF
ncbi:[FeFe] hydrogenase H-cluster radical SAM maturase HydG [Candidatus Micrarchaeota archaeon CG1_02_51_15]|nr:MAG: [FeFe] hydrogenase H-cluster radical SAM maturase HydG [Candidatus Micrarchaeota archaeon CG1_02_51_15]